MVWKAVLIALFCMSSGALAEEPSPAATPPMGWNSWNYFGTHKIKLTDALVRAQADAMVDSGMKDAGYVYVNIDDSWQGKRDGGILRPHDGFPDMKALADYIHGKGLKLGIYSTPGWTSCGGFPGSIDHEKQDAKTFARWGVDFLKYDSCTYYADAAREIPAYALMGKALKDTGRPIVFSLCQYGWNEVWKWGASIGGNMWRTTKDIADNWDSMSHNGFTQNGLEQYAGPGHWNDPDMLEIGNGGMKTEEYRTQMSLWSLLAAPLLAGNDLKNMSKDTLEILTNREVIAVDQDPAGVQGHRVAQYGGIEVWVKPLADGSAAVGLFNRWEGSAPAALDVKTIGMGDAVLLRDLWAHKDLGVFENRFETQVPEHGVVMLKAARPKS